MNTKISEGQQIDKIAVEEDLYYGSGRHHLWFCRCDCGRSRSWEEWKLIKGIQAGELLCLYCTHLKKRLLKHKGFVYLVHQIGTNYYKIGISKNLKQRLRSLQRERLTEDKLYLVKSINANRWIECQLHWRYDTQRQQGEWFEFVPTQVEDVVETMEEAKLSQTVTYGKLPPFFT